MEAQRELGPHRWAANPVFWLQSQSFLWNAVGFLFQAEDVILSNTWNHLVLACWTLLSSLVLVTFTVLRMSVHVDSTLAVPTCCVVPWKRRGLTDVSLSVCSLTQQSLDKATFKKILLLCKKKNFFLMFHFLAALHSTWDPCSPTRDWTRGPCIGNTEP